MGVREEHNKLIELKESMEKLSNEAGTIEKITDGLVTKAAFNMMISYLITMDSALTKKDYSPNNINEYEKNWEKLKNGFMEFGYEMHVASLPNGQTRPTKENYIKQVVEKIEKCPDSNVVRTDLWKNVYRLALEGQIRNNSKKEIEFYRKKAEIENISEIYKPAKEAYDAIKKDKIGDREKALFSKYGNTVREIEKGLSDYEKSGEYRNILLAISDYERDMKNILTLKEEYKRKTGPLEFNKRMANARAKVMKDAYDINKKYYTTPQAFTDKYKEYETARNQLGIKLGSDFRNPNKNSKISYDVRENFERKYREFIDLDIKMEESDKQLSLEQEKMKQDMLNMDKQFTNKKDKIKELKNKVEEHTKNKQALENISKTVPLGMEYAAAEKLLRTSNCKVEKPDLYDEIINGAKELLNKKDIKKGFHINTKVYDNMIEALEDVTKVPRGDNKKLADALKKLEKQTKEYDKAKRAQTRKHPSERRNQRLAYAGSIESFAINRLGALNDLEKFDDLSKKAAGLEAYKLKIGNSKLEYEKSKEQKTNVKETHITNDMNRTKEKTEPSYSMGRIG